MFPGLEGNLVSCLFSLLNMLENPMKHVSVHSRKMESAMLLKMEGILRTRPRGNCFALAAWPLKACYSRTARESRVANFFAFFPISIVGLETGKK